LFFVVRGGGGGEMYINRFTIYRVNPLR